MKTRGLPLVFAVAGILFAQRDRARAQSVEYGALEQLFGEPVTISATGKPQRVSEVPADMDIVTADDIRRSGAINIPDALRFVAGIDVRRYGEADAAVSIRGNNTALSPRVLVLLDGRQVYQDDYGLTVWPLIPVAMEDIRQIEVIKGPNAALYGFNAVSGVINIVTYDPLHDLINAVRVDGGTQDTARGEATTTFQIPGRLGVRVSAEGLRSREYVGTDALSTGEQPRVGNVAADVRLQVAPGIEWDLSASLGSLQTQTFADDGLFIPSRFQANSLHSRLAAETGIGLLQFDVYRNENRYSADILSDAIGWREDVTVAQASDLVKLGPNHTVRVALEYRDNSVASLEAFNGRLGYRIASASAMWDWQITPGLSLVNAIRIDDLQLSHDGAQVSVPGVTGTFYHDASLVEPSFNSGLVWKASEHDTIRLSAARATQLPSLVDFGFTGPAGALIIAGNPGLQPSTVMNYELDWDRTLPPLASTVRLALFHEDTSQVIGSPFGSGFTFLPTGQILEVARNFGDSHESGGAIALKGHSGEFRWDVSYALAVVHDDTPRAVLQQAPSVSLQRQTPTHAVVVGLGWTHDRWEIDGHARWQSHFEDYRIDPASLSTNQVTVPNYLTVNLRVAYRLTDHVTLALTAEQLNQHRLIESAGLRTERAFLVSATARF